LYIHMGRGLYYKSFSLKYTWLVGVTLFLLCIITAFLGYVLPWGQMSYWAATVITNLISAVPYIGNIVVSWLWGGFRVRNASLVRFYALHFLLPFVISGLSLLHIFFLHETGSSNPLGLDSSSENIEFQSYFTVKDSVGFLVIWGALGYLVLFFPNLLIDPENFIQANPLITPTHIQPEWYFLPIYAMLRAIPSKLGGVIALILSVRILYTFPFLKKLEVRSLGFSISESTNFWLVVSIFIVLGWIGSQAVEAPFEVIGQIFTALYFLIIIL
jgi:ubiquinol-cytochrome c reductase cytochrome b subunit